MNLLQWFFDSRAFEPHGYCFLWQRHILFLHVFSDAGIAFAYYLIPLLLFYFVRKRKDLPYKGLFLAFCAFILLCGTTHIMAIWVLWHPDYPLEGVIKALTAIVSIASLFILWRIVPKALAYIDPELSLLAAVVDSSTDAIITKTLDGVITSWNEGAEKLFGYSAEEAVGQHIGLIIPSDKKEEERKIIAQIKAGKRVEPFETVRVGKNGHSIDVSAAVSPVYDAAGKIIGASKVARDISVRKRLEEQILHHTKELEHSNQELEDFAHIVSHDLKEPIRGIGIQASFMLEDYTDKLDAEGIGKLEHITALCKRIDHMITDLLYYSKLDRIELAQQEVNPNEIVADVQKMMEPFIKERNARIIIPAPMPNIVCDKPRITEVFRNLITNALKHNDKDEPLVEVGFIDHMDTPHGPEDSVFFVRDNGVGIAPRFHEEIFQVLKKMPYTDDGRNAGAGVGLSFVKKIVERNHGHIWLESELGKGSTFYFNF